MIFLFTWRRFENFLVSKHNVAELLTKFVTIMHNIDLKKYLIVFIFSLFFKSY
jgi:hypothetical protein